ncbi:MAG: anti-sigma factor domain-containing protein [Gammaproteobacteria bacterium]
MAARLPDDEHLADLLATRAVEGLSGPEQDELNDYTARYPDTDLDQLDRIAASLALSGLRVEPMPASLRARIEADARAWFSRPEEAPPAAVIAQFPARPRPVTAWGGWLAAAASLVLAVVGWLQVDRLHEERAAFAARQAALEGSMARLERELGDTDAALAALRDRTPEQLMVALAARPGTLVLPWSATDDPAAGEAGGAVVWNPAEQAGLMRFSGLEANDPSVAQYQLWIFDAGRDDRFPVDGGVFDVPPGADEVLVPIRARLPVGEAVLFAITVEPPGGVVVSSRERIALVAQPGA